MDLKGDVHYVSANVVQRHRGSSASDRNVFQAERLIGASPRRQTEYLIGVHSNSIAAVPRLTPDHRRNDDFECAHRELPLNLSPLTYVN